MTHIIVAKAKPFVFGDLTLYDRASNISIRVRVVDYAPDEEFECVPVYGSPEAVIEGEFRVAERKAGALKAFLQVLDRLREHESVSDMSYRVEYLGESEVVLVLKVTFLYSDDHPLAAFYERR